MRAGQRGPNFCWLHLADAAELLHQQILFDVDLLGFIQMLQAATTADTEMRATRFYPVGCGGNNPLNPSLGKIPADVGINKLDLFAGQGPIDKHRLAVDMGHAPQIVGKGFDLGGDRGCRYEFTISAFGHLVQNNRFS